MGNRKGRGRDYTPNDETRETARKFLEAWEEAGGSFDSYRDFCEVRGFNYHQIRRLRSKWGQFCDAMDNIQARFGIEEQLEAPKEVAVEHHPDVEDEWAMWLETWRVTKDRMKACSKVGRTWAEVEAKLEQDEGFRLAYRKVEEEFEVAVEDALLRDALGGKASSINQLLKPRRGASESPVDVTASSGMRGKWKAIYGAADL